jgi:hypothetical protein
MQTFKLLVSSLFVLAVSSQALAQTTHLAVIVGLSGDPEHAELFQRWASTLVDASAKLGIARENVVYLSEKPEVDAKRITGKSTKEEIVKAFEALSKAGEEDVVFIVLIGHGSYEGKVAKFNLPGPDMTPEDFESQLKRLRSRHIVLVNTASSGAERFATLFGGYFADALAGTEADEDKNRRVSVLEAFTYAKREVGVAYEREGIMLTEHAMISDNGDREGTQQPSADGKLGRVASLLSLGTAEATDALPSDPKLRALYTERRDIERRIEALKLLKDSMEPAKYSAELERLATDLALKTRQIREAEGKLP